MYRNLSGTSVSSGAPGASVQGGHTGCKVILDPRSSAACLDPGARLVVE